MSKITICSVKDDYIDFLRTYDKKVSLNKGEKRRYVGALIEVNSLKYFAPLSSPKEKHKTFQNKKPDIIKLQDGELGVININNNPLC